MSDDSVKQLRDSCYVAFDDGTNDYALAHKAAGRIEELQARAEAAEAKLEGAVELLKAWLELSGHCSIEEGVCCCGDNMENHAPPMDCGHTPLDHGTYIAGHLEETTRTAIAQLKGQTEPGSDKDE